MDIIETEIQSGKLVKREIPSPQTPKIICSVGPNPETSFISHSIGTGRTFWSFGPNHTQMGKMEWDQTETEQNEANKRVMEIIETCGI